MPTLSRNVQRIVIRQGLQADIPALISAEMGWDTDKRVLRVGDNSPTPVKIMTDKSTDSFDFTSIPLIKFGKLEFQSGVKVGGLDLDSLNNSSGIIVRSPVSGVFSRTKIVSGDGSISVTNGEGIAGNIDVRVDPTIVAAIAAAQPATVTAGATAPVSPKLGDIWYNTTTHLTYLRITDGSTQQWKDIITDPNAAVGHAASYGPTAPVSPALGDMWFNTGDDTLYIRTNNGTADVWLDVSSAGVGGGGGSGVTATAGTTAPASPAAGDMWFNTTDDTLFIYSPVGGGTFAWIDVTTSGGSSGGGSGGAVDPWACVPVGALVTVDLGEGAGIVPSNTSSDYRYIELTAGLTGAGGYNNGVLTSETVTGSDPSIVATAVVSLTGSPLDGKTIHLINTERRFVRPGTAGTLEESANLAHTHTGVTDNSGGTGTFTLLTNDGVTGYGVLAYLRDRSLGPTQQAAGTGYNHTHTLMIDSSGGSEARPRSIGAKYYRRIK